jgi:hypothetical protein
MSSIKYVLSDVKYFVKKFKLLIIFLIIVLVLYLIFLLNKSITTYRLKNTFNEIKSNIWINKNSNIIFPELSPYSGLSRTYSPEGVSLAFEAGGRRSYAGFIGFIRGLYKIHVNGSNAFESAQFLSSVSGSSWLLGTYLFANKNIDKSLLLGEYIPPENINMDTLSTINFNTKENYYLGSRLVSTDIKADVQDGYDKGLHPEYIWNHACGRVFLRPYGLDKKIVSINETHANYIYNITGIKPITPNEKLPFWIAGCALLNVKNGKIRGTTLFQATPLYSGIPNVICNKDTPFGFDGTSEDSCVGGVFQSTYSVGSINPNINYNNNEQGKSLTLNLQIPLYQQNLFTLESIIGISGSSQATKFSYLSNFNDVIPSYNLWAPTSNTTTNVPIGDGAHCDWTGITSLLSRNVKHIVSIISCDNDINDNATAETYWDFCALNILNLFGLNNDELCKKEVPYLYESNNNQVFEKSDWPMFAQKLLDTKATGGPVFSRNKLFVLPNYQLGIKGGYYVDLLVIVVQSSSIYNSLLPKSITNTFSNSSGPFPSFPNYPMTDKNFNLLISLENYQINLLDSYIEWCVLYPSLKNTIINMYRESGMYF